MRRTWRVRPSRIVTSISRSPVRCTAAGAVGPSSSSTPWRSLASSLSRGALASRATWMPERKRYEILHVTSVDEDYNDVPNDTFTNASARKALQIATEAAAVVGDAADPRWSEVAQGLVLPFDAKAGHHLDFDASVPHDIDSWGGSSLPMLSYPSLDLPMDLATRQRDYAATIEPMARSHRDPNSMGFTPLSIAASTAGDTAAASEWFQRNITANVLKPPFNVRTETASNNTGYFATASGGLLQNILYGFTGLRIERDGLVQAYAPMLPEHWRTMTVKNVRFRGETFDITVDRDAAGNVHLERRPAATTPTDHATNREQT